MRQIERTTTDVGVSTVAVDQRAQHRPTRWLYLLGALTAGALVLTSDRYGYHRDELYFLAAGRHLAWGYPDQPPLTPLLARVMSALAPNSLVALRLPSALIGGAVVVLTGRIARELGAPRASQLVAAGCMAIAGGTMAITHTLGTSALDLCAWTVLTFLVLRILRGADQRWWLIVGGVLGVALENKWLIGFFAAALIAGLVISGPRRTLRSPWLWGGALIAAALWAPNLLWQLDHQWPALQLADSIAAGGSTSSQPRYLFVPFELLLMCPLLVPIWGVGLCRLLGAGVGVGHLRQFGAFGWAYLLLAAVFLVAGGKPYYLIGLYPILFAAGAEPTVAWAARRRFQARTPLLAAMLILGLLVDAVISLPVLPVRSLGATPVLDVNPDAGETVGWPQFVTTVATAYRGAPAGTVLLMGNYGEAGAVDRYGPAMGLPAVFSGHNAYGLWGPPDSTAGSAVVVGVSQAQLTRWFTTVRQVGVIDNKHGVDNEEQGEPVWLCTGQRLSWSQLWPAAIGLH